MPAEIFNSNYPFLPKGEILSFDEITRVAEIAISLGVKKIRLTGGEPLMRRDLPVLIQMLKSLDGLEDLALTTNAALLGPKAKHLKDAGLDRITISLDALDPQIFATMNGVGAKPDSVLTGIQAAQDAGLSIKLNSVIKKGVNDGEILPLVKFARDQQLTLRFIEYMDVGETNQWRKDEVLSSAEILDHISSAYELYPLEEQYTGETARRFGFADDIGEIGFISSVTQPFCGDCTRARLSADGQLFTCLFASKGHNLKSILRASADNTILKASLTSIWQSRSDRYSAERSEQSNISSSQKPEMSFIGG